MTRILRYFFLLATCCLLTDSVLAQAQSFKELYQVKRKETIFGIARQNGLTIQELIAANPEMNTPGYVLKKGDYIKIPYPSATSAAKQPAPSTTPQPQMPTRPVVTGTDIRYREIRVGVMLPLHIQNGDGKRMLEYYRGVLMACDSLKVNGISTDVRAWNVPEDGDLQQVLRDPYAAKCDLIIGPLYSKQVKELAAFVQKNNIRLLIPFSISAGDAMENPNVFQVFQNGYTLNHAYTQRFVQRFKDAHLIIIDCNDSTSTKGGFVTTLRRKMDQDGVSYSLTNLRTSEKEFKECFSISSRNVVVLNTSRQTEMNVAFAKLSGLKVAMPGLQISVFGYPEWLQYTRQQLDNMYKFDTYIPSTYYMSPLSSRVESFKKKYRWNFHQDMQSYPQRFAATGFDHAFFMIKGLHLYGNHFTGTAGTVGYAPLQTPLHFERVGNGGLQNKAIYFVHYSPDNRIETIRY